MEDAQRPGILRKEEVEEAFMEVIRCISGPDADYTYNYYKTIEDTNEAIAFLRARIINLLINESSSVFLDNREKILSGSFNDTLIEHIQNTYGALRTVQDISVKRIYGHDTVIQIEIAGYSVMSELLHLFIPALLKEKPSHKEQKVLKLLPY